MRRGALHRKTLLAATAAALGASLSAQAVYLNPARTFVNGTLNCGAGSCQGNYGSAFPFRYRRGFAPP